MTDACATLTKFANNTTLAFSQKKNTMAQAQYLNQQANLIKTSLGC